MTRKEIVQMVTSFGLPCTYNDFLDETDKVLPYVTYYYEDSSDFYADNKNFAKIDNLTIELYTKQRDFAIEETIETILNNNKITYTRYCTYVPDEKCYTTTYYTEVLING